MHIFHTVTNTEIAHSLLGFSAGERHVQLDSVNPTEAAEITIRARVSSSNDLLDLLLVANALRHKFGESLKLNLELPYMPYSRQDRVCAPGQAFSLQVISNLLKMLRLKKLVTWDCHSNLGVEMTGATNVAPVDIIEADKELSKLLTDETSVLVCPDKGAVDRCTAIKDKLGLNDIVFCEKRRDPVTGKILETDVFVDDLTGKCAVITDDICDGGFTFIQIARKLREKNVEKIVLFVTHGIFSKGLSVFDGLIDQVFTTNSFSQEIHPRLKVIDFEYSFTNSKGEVQ